MSRVLSCERIQRPPHEIVLYHGSAATGIYHLENRSVLNSVQCLHLRVVPHLDFEKNTAEAGVCF